MMQSTETPLLDIALLLLNLLAFLYGMRLYYLLRTGELGKAWLFIIFGVVFLLILAVMRIGKWLIGLPIPTVGERLIEMGFLTMLCYALWRQWSAFHFSQRERWKRIDWSRLALSADNQSSSQKRFETEEEKGEQGQEWEIKP